MKDAVREHWQQDPCGAKLADHEQGTAEFFADVERSKSDLEPFIPSFAEFDRWREKDVLEVGVGLGSDFMRFVRAGAHAYGVDLTEAAVELVRRRLAMEDLVADVRVGDAEALPFGEESFDLVYSWGVLHHTPDTRGALDEVRRVLRPGGEARIMLYSRRSWVALGVWLKYGLGRGRPQRSVSSLLADHMESPGTKAYTQAELSELFSGFRDVRYARYVTPYDRRVAGPIAQAAGPRFGWFVGISARR
jgi:ubiquinone/menaquinone biosynthesis C-methylase UbiE